ncbi:MAG: cytosine deaminase [Spirulinaceae cyanobacterium]
MLDLDKYCLRDARIPLSLLPREIAGGTGIEEGDFCLVDLVVEKGAIAAITPTSQTVGDLPIYNLNKGIVLPCFVDLHTHLDKGHIWARTPNPDGTFNSAVSAAQIDAEKYWQAEDVYRRMEFSLKCSYVHGTKAIRTHIDCFGKQGEISLAVFQTLQKEWQHKLILQPVSLVTLDYYQTPPGMKLADKIAEMGGILGGVAYVNPQLKEQLDILFTLAKERSLDLDLHTDENDDPNSNCLHQVAEIALKHNFPNQIVCGHCCSLAVQNEAVVQATLDLVKKAKIGIVSLPLCNLYLQDRQQNKTPFWRGITSVKEINHHHIPLTFASDNCRDSFFAFGDLDVLEVFNQAVRIAQLDIPYGNSIDTVTKTAADLMKLPQLGRIKVGLPADLILFKARNYNELLARSQHDRIVLRQGKATTATLPDYEELDDL